MTENEKWVTEIDDVAKSCGYETLYIPDRGGLPAVAIAKPDLRPVSHISALVWEYLNAHGDAAQWLSLWLNACSHSVSKRSTTP